MPPPLAEPRSLTTKVYRDLRAGILSCRLKPGEKLRIAKLQEWFETSPSAIREALARLSTEGLVHAQDQRGFTVAPVSRVDLEDLIRTRRKIEALALRQAIELGGQDWEAELTQAYTDLAGNLSFVELGEAYVRDPLWVDHHEEFHRALISGCDSKWLMTVCATLAERTQRYRYLTVKMSPHRNATGEHREIFEAALSRDADLAASLLDAHFSRTATILMANSDAL